MAEQITIVDKNDNVIGHKVRDDITHDDIYRVATLWIMNSKGEILLAKRALTKSHNPGEWGPAVAGTVAYNESYKDTIFREAREELGISDFQLQELPKRYSDYNWAHFAQDFKTILDYSLDKFTIQPEEVAEIKWFSKDEFNQQNNEHPELFLKSNADIINNYL